MQNNAERYVQFFNYCRDVRGLVVEAAAKYPTLIIWVEIAHYQKMEMVWFIKDFLEKNTNWTDHQINRAISVRWDRGRRLRVCVPFRDLKAFD